jgi:flagellar FliJ protein
MAKFKFKLQKVLDARETIENIRKKELMKSRNELAALQQEKKRITDEMTEQRKEFYREKEEKSQAISWKVMQSYLDMLESLKMAVNSRIEKQQEVVAEKRQALMEARRERRAMEILRDKQYEEYLWNENRLDQAVMNEIANWQTLTKKRNQDRSDNLHRGL